MGEAARRAGLSLEDIISCGDAENDLSMGNGPVELRAQVARQVVDRNDYNSFAMALKGLFAIQEQLLE